MAARLTMAAGLGFAMSPVVASAQNFEIQSVTATGSAARFPPSNVLDGDLNFASRWTGNGSPEEIVLDLGSNRTVDDVQIAWGRGDQRTHTFDIAGRAGIRGNWIPLFSGTSNGRTAGFENFNVNDTSVRQVRIRGLSNSVGSKLTYITEVRISGTGGSDTSSSPTISPSPTSFGE